jgi:hypothetical protein
MSEFGREGGNPMEESEQKEEEHPRISVEDRAAHFLSLRLRDPGTYETVKEEVYDFAEGRGSEEIAKHYQGWDKNDFDAFFTALAVGEQVPISVARERARHREDIEHWKEQLAKAKENKYKRYDEFVGELRRVSAGEEVPESFFEDWSVEDANEVLSSLETEE